MFNPWLCHQAAYVPTRTPGHLHVGDICDAFDVEQLRRNRIDFVVTAFYPYGAYRGALTSLYNRLGIRQAEHDLEDIPEQMLDFRYLSLDEIHWALVRGENVLVHCQAGVSRSVSICIAYLILYEEKTVAEALHILRTQRPIANPNEGFLLQLLALSERESRRSPTWSQRGGGQTSFSLSPAHRVFEEDSVYTPTTPLQRQSSFGSYQRMGWLPLPYSFRQTYPLGMYSRGLVDLPAANPMAARIY